MIIDLTDRQHGLPLAEKQLREFRHVVPQRHPLQRAGRGNIRSNSEFHGCEGGLIQVATFAGFKTGLIVVTFLFLAILRTYPYETARILYYVSIVLLNIAINYINRLFSSRRQPPKLMISRCEDCVLNILLVVIVLMGFTMLLAYMVFLPQQNTISVYSWSFKHKHTPSVPS